MCRRGARKREKLPSFHASSLTKCTSFRSDSIGERKGEHVVTGRNCEILFAVYGIGHRRRVRALPHVEMPKSFPCMPIYRLKGSRIVSEEHKTRRCCHHSGKRVRISDLWHTPYKLIPYGVIGNQHFFRIVVRAVLHSSRVIGLTLFELLNAR